MEFLGAFVSGILSTVLYVMIFLGVYKLYYIAKHIHEIKDLMERKLRNAADAAEPSRAVAPAVTAEVAKKLSDEDAASTYAEQLLRAVNAESPSTSATHEVR